MTDQDTNLARLEKMIALVDGSLTKDEFVTAFEEVMKLVLRIEKRNADAVDLIEQTWGKMYGKMQNDHSMTLSEMKAGVNELFVGEQLRKIREDLTAKIDTKLAEVKDGKTPSKEELKALIVPLIPPPKKAKDGSPDTPAQIRDKLETLKDEDRLDASAIKGLEDRLKRIENRPTRGGGTSAIGVRQAFKYIAHTEQPTGVIDGANLTYTVKNEIFWIAGFTLNGEQVAQLPNFTVSGRTITFATALPAVYSGKDFECKYIG